MSDQNALARRLASLDRLPPWLRPVVLTRIIGATVKFVGTAGVKCETLTETEGIFTLANHRRAQNHIGSVHAAAMALLAETATGMVVGMNVPDAAVPVIKSLHVDYNKRTKGALRAHATLTAEQIARIKGTQKGEVTVPVVVTDESGREPIACEMVWAWVPKKRKPKPTGE